MDNPKVSVIMPVYNGEKYIVGAIESVLNQTYNNFEIVIVNDGSTDKTFHKIEPYLTLSNVIYREQKNSGLPAARNTGIRASSGEYIAFLDHDDLWVPDKLEMQVEFMREHPEVGLVHGNISYIDQNGTPFVPNPAYQTDISGNCYPELFMGNRIAVLTVLIRRECIMKVGYFDEGLRSAEDYDMWLRISRNYPLGHIDKRLAVYRKHPDSMSHNIIKAYACVLIVLIKTLKEFPDTWQRVGNDRVQDRLFNLTNYVATLCFDSGNYMSALWYLLKTIKVDIAKFGLLYLHAFLTFVRKTIFIKKGL